MLTSLFAGYFAMGGLCLFLSLWWLFVVLQERKRSMSSPLPCRVFSHVWWRDMYHLLCKLDAAGTLPPDGPLQLHHPIHDILTFCWHRAWDRRLRLEREEGI